MSSLRRGRANIISILPMLTDDPQRIQSGKAGPPRDTDTLTFAGSGAPPAEAASGAAPPKFGVGGTSCFAGAGATAGDPAGGGLARRGTRVSGRSPSSGPGRCEVRGATCLVREGLPRAQPHPGPPTRRSSANSNLHVWRISYADADWPTKVRFGKASLL